MDLLLHEMSTFGGYTFLVLAQLIAKAGHIKISKNIDEIPLSIQQLLLSSGLGIIVICKLLSFLLSKYTVFVSSLKPTTS